MTVRIFGIRHHGPGSARSLRSALEEWQPDAVLIEGPPEGDKVAALAASEQMHPPVSMLVYAPDRPRRAAFYPFALFSPEWQALTYALRKSVTVRFIDLPAANFLAPGRSRGDGDDNDNGDDGNGDDNDDNGDGDGEDGPVTIASRDPLAALAGAAGYSDPERWWEDMVEHQLSGTGPFEAVAEAMAELRTGEMISRSEAQREAAMRQNIRAAVKEGYERVAVVCGAWHVPALTDTARPSASADASTLKRLPKIKVVATWVPWTYSRLSVASGYGAGITSPGWYHHLFTSHDQVINRWMVKVAHLLRGEDLDAAPANVIEAVRIAEALATMRGRPLAGLAELNDATQTVLCHGSDLPMRIITERLVVGEHLGEVPDDTPMVPLAQDLAKEQRRLRLKPEASVRQLDLDLRRPLDLDRSHLLHRLDLLEVYWGEPEAVENKAGTFHEVWQIQWYPELEVALIEASMWGNTVPAAATAAANHRAGNAPDLATVTGLVERCLLADLPEGIEHAMRVLADRAAVDVDTGHLMRALPPLARVLRYGDVRRTDASAIGTVIEGLVARVSVGLGAACASLDDDAATGMVEQIVAFHAALALLDRPDLAKEWQRALQQLVDQRDLHGLVAGRGCRLLHDAGALPDDDVARRMSLALSLAEDPSRAAAWVEGFLSGSGMVLLHDDSLLRVVDGWITGVAGDAFTDVLPLLRRTFSTFAEAERRQIGEKIGSLDRSGFAGGMRAGGADGGDDLEVARAEMVLPTMARLLGLGEP